METKIYYYNNRPVKVLREEGEGFVFVAAVLNLSHDITGSNFCHGCMVGHHHHDCEEAQEVIDAVMENVSDEEVFWVNKQYLKEQPFEYKECESLVVEIEKLKKEKERYVKEVEGMGEKSTKAQYEFLQEQSRVSALQREVRIQEEELEKVKKEIQDKREELKTASFYAVGNTGKSISTDKLLDLYKAEATLELLERGGVDNWEWYAECFPDDFNLEKEAFDRL